MKFKYLLLSIFLFALPACAAIPTLKDLQATAVAGTLEAVYAQTETANQVGTAVAATVAAQGGVGAPPVEATVDPGGLTATPGTPSTPTPGEPAADPTATPVPQDLVLGAVGFGQEERRVGLGFFVTNPNPELTITDARYVMTIYDAGGKILVLDDFQLPVLFPGHETGIARTVFMPEEATAATVVIELEPGTAHATGPLPAPAARGAVIRQGSVGRVVVAEIDNPFPFFIDDMEAAALLLDADGRIVGGGLGYSQYAGGESSNGAQAEVYGAASPARAVLFPLVREIPAPDPALERPDGVVLPELGPVEFVQPDEGFALYTVGISNPNTGHAIPGTGFTLIGYAQDGSILMVETNGLRTLGPGMESALAGRLHWEGGGDLARMEVRLNEDLRFEPSDPIAPITFENVLATGDETFGYTITGDLVNPFAFDLEYVWVHIVVRSETGALLYANWLNISLVPAGQTIVFELRAAQLKTVPGTIEVHALVPDYEALQE